MVGDEVTGLESALRHGLQKSEQRRGLKHFSWSEEAICVNINCTLVHVFRDIGNNFLDELHKSGIFLFFKLAERPVAGEGEDVLVGEHFPYCSDVLQLKEAVHPSIPRFLVAADQMTFHLLLAYRVVDGVVADQLQVPQTPIVAQGSHKVICCRVLISKFPRVVGIDAHGIPQSQQHGTWGVSKISLIAEQQVRNGIFLEANVSTMGEELSALEDVDAVTDAHATCFHCDVDVVSEVIAGFTSMISFSEVGKVGVALKDTVNDRVIGRQRLILILLLYIVEPYQPLPVCSTGHFKHLLTKLFFPHLETYENHPKGEIGIDLSKFLDDWIQWIYEGLEFVAFHEVPLCVVFV
jgi:hypothetical protein